MIEQTTEVCDYKRAERSDDTQYCLKSVPTQSTDRRMGDMTGEPITCWPSRQRFIVFLPKSGVPNQGEITPRGKFKDSGVIGTTDQKT